jgi:hypothetical protein
MKYPWKRFWCPREGTLNLTDGGFLFDPEDKYAKYVASDVVPFESIAHLSCLALLGEPGIGKSTAMEDIQHATERAAQVSNEKVLYINLNEYGDESRLINEVFNSGAYQEWLAGSHCLHLFLDSLDECRIRVGQVGTILAEKLKQAKDHLGRLRLRIACRTADWPPTLEIALPGLWGDKAFGAFELVPLRRKDVQAAAEAEGVDVDRFFAEVRRTESAPLANKPITLRFLLSAFKSCGQFPATRQELYELGCSKLCEEANPNRQDLRLSGGTGWLSAEQRMAVASRIAAVSLFCRKPVMITGSLPAQASSEEVLIASFVGGQEPAGAGQVDVSNEAVLEAVGTGLFSSRGPGRMGFAHQTYAEFLASRYLAMHAIPPDRVLSLLRHPEDPEGHVVPQLYEVAAWVAGTNSDVLRTTAQADPQVLLRGDAASLAEADRCLIVDALLVALDERRAADRDWDLYRQYHKLKHAGLAEQLRAWIADKSRYFIARDVAIEIAETCECSELQSLLADVALDQSEELRLRASAARAVAKVGDSDTRRRLLSLAMGQGGDDPQDQLKGCALRALWPGLISAEELFRHMTLPKQSNFHGAYSGFLTSDLLERLGTTDLPHALSWLKALASKQDLDYFLRRIADQIVTKAWSNTADPLVLTALAELCIEYFKHHRGVIHDDDTIKEYPGLFDAPANRRALAAKIVELSQDRVARYQLTGHPPCLIRNEDFEWCLDQLRLSVGGKTESVWAELVWSLFCWGQPDARRLDMVIEAREQSPALRSESELFFTPVELGSERAEKIRKDYYDARKWSRKPRKKRVKPPPKERIEHWLRRCESGEPNVWWVLLQEMTLEDTSTQYGIVPLDVRRLPGWQNADASTKQRMLAAADRFLRYGLVDPLKWLREPHSWGTFHVAGYAAIFLLKTEAPATYYALPGWAWERHVATVLCSPFFHEEESQKSQHEEVALKCYQQAKNAALFYLPMQIDAEDRDKTCDISCDRKLGRCWDDHLKRTLHEKLIEAQVYWHTSTFGQIAELLLIHGYQPTRELLVGMVRSVVEGTCSNMERALTAAAHLIAHSSDAAWSIIWPAVLANRVFGRDLLMSVAHGLHHNAAEIASKLTEDQLGDLFIWLANEFPYSEDREHERVYSPSKDDSARELRNGVIRFLEDRGTPASVIAIQRTVNALPNLDWLRSVLIEARKNTLRKTWRPCAPAELIRLARQPDTRLVRNAGELQVLLVEALGALEQRLQGETYAAPDLWDQTDRTRGQEKFRPKDEGHLSDWVKRNLETELKTRGVVMSREPEIRRGEGSGTGESTDIHVTALVPGLTEGSFDQARVIIEVKGCWHRELKTAMKTQLVDRYLKDNQCQHGIYLVGWYVCPQWDDDDHRSRDTPEWPLEEARNFFEKQAAGLSGARLTIRSFVMNAALR